MVELSAWLNIVGLLFDIVGVVLIYLFGISPTMHLTEHHYVLKNGKATPITTYHWLARTGLGLLIFGFSLQAAGSAVILL